jgi:RNA polymerase sigma-70 factor (ECF subfamily)
MNEEELVRQYGDMVYNLALRLTQNRAEAEDLAQESLIKAVSAWSSFRGEADPGTWLYRITVNTWKNMVRAKSKWRFLRFFSKNHEEQVATEPEDVPGPDLTPEAEAESREKKRGIERAMQKLSPEERAVLVLRELDGRSYEEIRKSLDIPLGTVKSRLARARDILAEELSKMDRPHGS